MLAVFKAILQVMFCKAQVMFCKAQAMFCKAQVMFCKAVEALCRFLLSHFSTDTKWFPLSTNLIFGKRLEVAGSEVWRVGWVLKHRDVFIS